MSDEQQAGTQVTTGEGHEEPKWGDEISDERKRELAGRIAAWEALPEAERGERKSPFHEVSLTGADVFWLAALALAMRAGKFTDDQAVWQAQEQLRRAIENIMMELSFRVLAYRLDRLHLEGARLRYARLKRAFLAGAHLDGVDLEGAQMGRANLVEAHLKGAFLRGASLKRADLVRSHLEGADLQGAHLENAHLAEAHLEGALLQDAHLEGADLSVAHLRQTFLAGTRLERVDLRRANLEGTFLRGATLDVETRLRDAVLTEARVADVNWGRTNLTVVDWELVPELGDEREVWAWKRETNVGKTKEQRSRRRVEQERERLETVKAAVRANRQLATALQDQGMNEDAAKYAERAQRLQRRVLRLQGKRGRAAWSWFLDALAGYGYRPGRTVFWYLTSVGAFALLYWLASRGYITFGLKPSQFISLPWYEALVLSVSSFHGRGFFQPVNSLGDPVAILAAMEAVVGLIIEVSFIATFTQRFFGSK